MEDKLGKHKLHHGEGTFKPKSSLNKKAISFEQLEQRRLEKLPKTSPRSRDNK